jgi:hypothetical protein
MNNGNRVLLHPISAAVTALSLTLACVHANAQVAPSGTGATGGSSATTGGSSAPTGGPSGQTSSSMTGGTPVDPNPWYIGVSQAFTHDSNVYRIPDGPSDTYSSTSLLGGFDQLIGRQRVFGRATVSGNRYLKEDTLDNVSYGVTTGIDWETIEHLSGNIIASFNQNLASQPVSNGTPVAARNIAQTQGIGARIRLGGVSLLTLEVGADYSNIDYSLPAYVTSESNHTSGTIYLYYGGGGPLRVGAGFRGDRTRTPQAFLDPATGQYLSTKLTGQNFDLLADYDLTGRVGANARLSYTKQTTLGGGNADFSGFTGNVGLSWQATGKITVRVDAARDAGFDAHTYNYFSFTQTTTGVFLTPVVGLYQNNEVTTSAGATVNYAATAKISATANARYIRARLTNGDVTTAATTPDTVDVSTIVSLGANYEITRNWGAACNLAYAKRDVSGAVNFAYDAKTIGCSTQFTWR